MRIFLIFGLILGLFLLSCQESSTTTLSLEKKQPEAISLFGEPLFEPNRSPQAQAKLESNLEIAKSKYDLNPKDEMNIIWYGRRIAYLSHYQEAIDIYTNGLTIFPDSYKLLRHRGHRYISLRKFNLAIEDLKKAAKLAPASPLEIEPDGIPNKINTPLSSTQFNIWYHLALAYYLVGDYENAEKTYQKCMEVSVYDDLICATVDWHYMTLGRMGQLTKAKLLLGKVHDKMEVIENDSYYKRLMMYQGKLSPDSVLFVGANNSDQDLALATQGYGVGNWFLRNGDTTKATGIFEKVIKGKHWSAFGFIAAESDLARMKKQID